MVPYAGDPVAQLAQHLIETQAGRLPDLSRCIILLAEPSVAPHLRRMLLDYSRAHGYEALLGPRITTLRGWLDDFIPSRVVEITDYARELMLLEALQAHPTICHEGNPWVLTESLIALFDELTLHEIAIPEDGDHFSSQLAVAYGITHQPIDAQSREAVFVHSLWQAWLQQYREENIQDSRQTYLEKLMASLQRIPPGIPSGVHAPEGTLGAQVPADMHFYLAGFDKLTRSETLWVRTMADRRQATLFVQGESQPLSAVDDYHPDAICRRLLAQIGESEFCPPAISVDHFGAFLDQVYAPRPSAPTELDTGVTYPLTLAQRAQQFAAACPASPAAGRLSVFAARDAEEETRAVDIQIRRWFLAGKQHIAVISEDRRLARRLRALLERAGIILEDHAGWALSTTSAAAALERLLQAIEEDYAHEPLLDLLKSPFIFPDRARDALMIQVYRLENDIILHENIPRNLDRYRQHIGFRHARLGWPDGQQQELLALLDDLEQAYAPLLPFVGNQEPHSPKSYPPGKILDALLTVLQNLGLWQTFQTDDAGQRVIHELQAMRQATAERHIKVTWLEFRSWLGRALECATFTPARSGGQVQLFTLAQSRLQCFDAAIIAGADEHHLPGPTPRNPFFNDAVRKELGLPLSRELRAIQFYHFRRILECAPHILLTYHHTRDGEDIQPTPWLALLNAFHRLGYGEDLPDHGLGHLVRLSASEVVRGTGPGSSLQPAAYPRPTLPTRMIPLTYSASRYQQLMDCPYQFFAASGLGLKAPETIREALEKSDFGERVHRILQYFHDPGRRNNQQWPQQITPEQRDQAIHLLEGISRREFRRDLEDNLLHQGWLQRWLDIIPDYIDWQIRHAREWQLAAVELRAASEMGDSSLKLRGRLDRIDKCRDGLAIIDYKTGIPPSQQEVNDGEAVQLPFYALLTDEPVVRTEYLVLEKNRVKSGAFLENDQLARLRDANYERLVTLVDQIQMGVTLPAWGDEKVCSYCPVSGVCRKQAWSAAGSNKQ